MKHPPKPFDLHPESGLPMCIEEPMPLMEKLDAIRQAYRVLNDLEESVDALVYGLASIHEGGLSCAHILLRAFQQRQETDSADPEESERAP